MNLQQHFNFKRFYEYLKFDILINSKKYIVFVAVLFIILLVIDLLAINYSSSKDLLKDGFTFQYFFTSKDYQVLYVFTFLTAIVLVVGSSFPELRNKDSTTSYLLLPASIFEKYLVQFFLRFVVFTIIFTLVFWVVFKLASTLHNFFEVDNYIPIKNFALSDFISSKFKDFDIYATVLSMFSFASLFFASTTFFKKNAIIKTILLLGILVFVTSLFNVLLSHLFLPNVTNGFETELYVRYLDNGLRTVEVYIAIIGAFSCLFFLPLAYFKLKEKQV